MSQSKFRRYFTLTEMVLPAAKKARTKQTPKPSEPKLGGQVAKKSEYKRKAEAIRTEIGGTIGEKKQGCRANRQ